ncbi:MAG TPA: DegT/DnrJ/EryC1/StrS family aminotransferase [bacterium]
MIPVAKPWLGPEEIEAVKRPLSSGWVTQGPEVAAFEKEFAAYVGASHACAVSNCTTALHLALRAVGVNGGEVITVSHTFVATSNSIRYCGAIPVFVDIDPKTFNINPVLIESAVGPQTRAILVVHQIGMPCDMAGVLAVAKKKNLPVVEDAACAVGAEIKFDGKWEKIGKPHGAISCFSFHPRKLLTTGDGGMLTTHNPEWDAKFRLWRQHCMSVPDTKRHGSKEVIFEEYVELGFNYRMTDIQAAVGREQLKRIPLMIENRRKQAARYKILLSSISGVIPPFEPEWAHSNYQSYCIYLPEGLDQKEVMQKMLDAGVSTRRAIMNTHREPAYVIEPWTCGEKPLPGCNHPKGVCERLKESVKAQERAIILPLFHLMTEAEQDQVVESLKRACQKG